MKPEKIKIEEKFLQNTDDLIQNLLDQHFGSSKAKLDAFSKHRIKDIVKRMISQEVEYLHNDPDTYFDIYGEDYLGN